MAELAEKLSILVQDQLPDFVRDNYDTFQAFLVAYYEFTEQNTEIQYAIQNSESYKDIDETIDSFVDYFIKDYAYNLPGSVFLDQQFQNISLSSNTVESKRAFAKHLLKYHSAKGTEGAAKLLFRLLFDDEITFYYPKEDILKPSDGSWKARKSIHLFNPAVDFSDYAGYYVEGNSSQATAVLDTEYLVTPFGGGNVHEMLIEFGTQDGEFVVGEQVVIKAPNATTGDLEVVASGNTLNVISSIEIVDGGLGYTSGSFIYNNFKFIGTVSAVSSTGKIKEVSIANPVNFVSPYNAASVISLTVSGVQNTFSGRYEANANVAAIVLFDTTGNSITHGLTTDDTVNVEFTAGIISAGNLFRVNSVLSSKKFTIANANIIVNSTGNITLHTQNANLKPVLGVVSSYLGSYLNKGGHLSDIKKVQDSDYYQEYSYVIRANQSSQYWADIIKKALHPAGMKLFSEVYLTTANSIVSVSVQPVPNRYQTILRFLKILATEPPIQITVQPSTIMALESFARISRDTRYRIGSTYNTLENFKYEYDNLRIYDVGDLSLQFLSQNINEPILFAPPDDILQGTANLVLNSRFSSSSNWALGSGYAIALSNLQATATSANTVQTFTGTANSKYMATYEVRSISAGSVRFASNSYIGEARTTDGSYSEIFFNASVLGNAIIVGNGFTGNVSNVHVKKLESIVG